MFLNSYVLVEWRVPVQKLRAARVFVCLLPHRRSAWTRHWPLYAAMPWFLRNMEGTPAARRTLLSAQPHRSFEGTPTRRGMAIQLAKEFGPLPLY